MTAGPTSRTPDGLLTTFISLVGSQASIAVSGFVFWALAARNFATAEVGIGFAMVTAMGLIAMVGVFGLNTLLIERFRQIPDSDRRPLLVVGLVIAASGSALIATTWLALSTIFALPGTLGHVPPSSMGLLVLASAISAACVVFDHAALGLGSSRVQLWRNVIAALLRVAVLAAVIAAGRESGATIVVAWAVGLAVSLLLMFPVLSRRLPDRSERVVRMPRRIIGEYWRVSLEHYGLTLVITSGTLLLPMVVAATMPPDRTAYFGQAQLLASSLYAFPLFLSVSLFATASDVEDFRRDARRTVLWGMVFAAAALAGSALLGRLVLGIFGANYARESLPVLLILAAALPALVIRDHFVVLRRLQGRRRRVALEALVWTAAEVTAAAIGARSGSLVVLCGSWVACTTVCALIAAPIVVRATRAVPGRAAS